MNRNVAKPSAIPAADPSTDEEARRAMVSPGFRLMILAVVALAVGALIGIAARGFVLTDTLIGFSLAGLLLLAPLPMLAGDVTDALLVMAAQRRWLSIERYQRTSAWLVPGVVAVVGIAAYPVVLAIGGPDLLGVFVVIGSFFLFGVLPAGSWLVGRLRRPRSGT